MDIVISPAQHVPQDVWRVVAAFLVEKHTLRTVYDVAQDLFSLQLVCKGSSQCATGVWPSVVRICAKPHVKIARSRELSADKLRDHLVKRSAVPGSYVLQNAVQLPAEQLTVFLQVQADKHAQINHKNATKSFGLTYSELSRVQKPAFTSLKGRSYLKQAVVATAKRKWGSLEVFHHHQAAAQQQEAERQYMWMREPKRQCLDREAQDALHWLWEETDYRELEQQARDNAEDKWYCEHGEDNTTEHEYDPDTNFEGNSAEDADWTEELEVAYTDAKRTAVSAWWASHYQYAWAMDEIPDGLQQFVPADEHQMHELDQQ